MTKFETTYKVVKAVADELNVTIAEAATKMQGTAAKHGNEEAIEQLHKVKMKSLGLV